MKKPIKKEAELTVKKQKDPFRKTYQLLSDLKLTHRQKKFIALYCLYNFNSKKAYYEAGYEAISDAVAETTISVMIRKQNVREGLQRYLADILGPAKTELEKKLFDTWFTQAFYDPNLFYNPDGTVAFTSWEQIPQQYRCCVDNMEVRYYGKDAERKVLVLHLIDRKWAQAMLDKYIGMTKEIKVIELVDIPAKRKKELNDMFKDVTE